MGTCLLRLSSRSSQVLTDIRADKSPANDGLSSSLLILYLDSARNLPVGSTVGTPGGAHSCCWCLFTPARVAVGGIL